MASKLKKKAIVFGLSSDMVFAVASVIQDIKSSNSGLSYDIVIYHDGISSSDYKALQKLYPVKLKRYSLPMNTLGFNQNTLDRFSLMVFSKYECFKLLNIYDAVLWLDYDIVIKKNIEELFSFDESHFKIIRAGNNSKVEVQLHYPIEEYDMEAQAVCASTFALSADLTDFNSIYEFCIDSLGKYANALNYGEQAIIDFAIQEFNINIEWLDENKYSCHPKNYKYSNSASILHAYGYPKFWNGINNVQFDRNYNQWLELGGTPYQRNSFNKINRKIRSRINILINKLRNIVKNF